MVIVQTLMTGINQRQKDFKKFVIILFKFKCLLKLSLCLLAKEDLLALEINLNLIKKDSYWLLKMKFQ